MILERPALRSLKHSQVLMSFIKPYEIHCACQQTQVATLFMHCACQHFRTYCFRVCRQSIGFEAARLRSSARAGILKNRLFVNAWTDYRI